MVKKLTQAEAQFGRGNPIDHCGICQFYQGFNRCSKVMGKISPYGLSRVYKRVNNPFGATLVPREVQMIKNMAADAADRSGG